jgi:membrane peptidoglycan carboxypeptidase
MNLDALDLTFVLGTASPSGLDVANAYATFANQGIRAQTTFITRVIGANDGLLFEFDPQLLPEFSPDVANTVNYALERVVNSGTGKAALALGRPAGAKTGTTDDNKSAWFAGFTPQLSAAVLMAKEDSSGMPISMSGTGGLQTVTGGSFPAAIWTAFMRDALKNDPIVEFVPPPADALVPIECPDFIEADLEDIPFGCPVPEIINEFGPEEGMGSGPDPFETEPVDPALPEEPDNEFGPDPATVFEDPTVDEGRPE